MRYHCRLGHIRGWVPGDQTGIKQARAALAVEQAGTKCDNMWELERCKGQNRCAGASTVTEKRSGTGA